MYYQNWTRNGNGIHPRVSPHSQYQLYIMPLSITTYSVYKLFPLIPNCSCILTASSSLYIIWPLNKIIAYYFTHSGRKTNSILLFVYVIMYRLIMLHLNIRQKVTSCYLSNCSNDYCGIWTSIDGGVSQRC